MPPSLVTRPPYRYRCDDRSWLTGFISARIAPRVEAWLPAGWSANAITLLGSALIVTLLVGVAGVASPEREHLAPVWVALLWGYCLLDHVDGCRARRRRSSSPWGEFLDHALDAWHGGIAVFVVGVMGGNAVHAATVVVTIAAVALATVVTWQEQKIRGEFSLAAIGPVEAVLAAGVYLLLWRWPAAARVLVAPLPVRLALTPADLALLAGAAGSLVTAALAVRRCPAVARPFAAVALAAGVIVALGFDLPATWTLAGLAIVILTAEYSARVITSHLTGSPMPWPDAVGPALLVVAAMVPAESSRIAAAALLWLAGRAIITWRTAAQKLTVDAAPAAALVRLETEG
jgi:phosphatidylglycerophosphate synthase